MKKIDCHSVCQEIEEADRLQLQDLSLAAKSHLQGCAQCKLFLRQRLKLQEIVSSLVAVEAPSDFDFQLRARLVREQGHFFRKIASLSFGWSTIAPTIIGLLVGGSLLLRVVLRDNLKGSRENSSTTVAIAPPAREDLPAKQKQSTTQNVRVESSQAGPTGVTKPIGHKMIAKASSRSIATKDFSSVPALVFRTDQSVATAVAFPIFPIGTSYQSLKVSLDDDSGISRTISVPTVSFGSQRVLTGSPVVSTSKGVW
jgi:hypothetical protein